MYTFLKLDTDWSLSLHNILNYKTIKIIQNIDTSGLKFLIQKVVLNKPTVSLNKNNANLYFSRSG